MLKKIFPVSFSNLPFTILVIGIFYSVINILMSYLGTAFNNDLKFFQFIEIVKLYSIQNWILLTMSFLVGVGILGVKRWAFFLYLVFNSILIIHGIYFLIKFWGLNTDLLSTESLITNMLIVLISFILTLYMLNSEISTPYLTLLPRGFRKKWRTEIPLKGFLKDSLGSKILIQTLDVSPSGCLATANGYLIEEGTYDLEFDIEKPWKVSASVVRSQPDSVGLKFNYTSSADIRKFEIKKFLESKLVPRYSTTLNGEFEISGKKITGEILNLSEGGLYVSSSEKVNLKDQTKFQFKLWGISFLGKGKISWINNTSEYQKSQGFGISFESISKKFIFNIFIFALRTFTHFENRER
jgi:hypothetical protein